MKMVLKYIAVVASVVLLSGFAAPEGNDETHALNTKEIIFEHIKDAYWWHIATINGHEVAVYLPVIVYSKAQGLNFFSSKRLEHGQSYNGFHIASTGRYAGKIVASPTPTSQGTDAPTPTPSLRGTKQSPDEPDYVRPIDLSLTKTAFAIVLSAVILLVIVLTTARWYRRHPKHAVPGGFVGMIEMLVMNIEDDVIRKSVGKDYALFSPYLLTAFFFIFINNLMGLIPVFPFGANVTGNIAVTLVLAVCTMLAVNLFGNREYWKEIFWPHVPMWLKVPLPLMPLIELFGVISKPFALTIRLFANITAGHAVALSLVCMIFATVKMGAAAHAGMTAFSVILAVFMSVLELLVAYIQAYVFTMLSAVFIGLARQEKSPPAPPKGGMSPSALHIIKN